MRGGRGRKREGKEDVNLIIVHIVSHKCNLCVSE